MGIDIQFFVERRKGDRWVSCDEWRPDPAPWDPDLLALANSFYTDRNKNLFAILADVYNIDDFNVIAMPKGLPDDMSPKLQVRAAHEIEEYDGFSPTWLSLAEILDFNWNQTLTREGFAHGPPFYEWISKKRKHGIGPPDLIEKEELRSGRKVVTEDEIQTAAEAIKREHDPKLWDESIWDGLSNMYCHVSWTVPYRHFAENFFEDTVDELKKLGKPRDVRCVFWFG